MRFKSAGITECQKFMEQHYELTYIVPIKYLDDELANVCQAVNGLIKKLGGKISSETNLGSQRLGYPIKNVHQGTYVALEFDIDSGKTKELSAQLILMPEILRHLIIVKRIKTEEEKRRELKIQEGLRKAKEQELSKLEEKEKAGVKKEEPAIAAKPAPQKGTLEDLDKKLDEILTEDIL